MVRGRMTAQVSSVYSGNLSGMGGERVASGSAKRCVAWRLHLGSNVGCTAREKLLGEAPGEGHRAELPLRTADPSAHRRAPNPGSSLPRSTGQEASLWPDGAVS